ncbi:MAG TPA: hypothetical protein VEU47_13225 [Candidatus Cybelea sp.]|nr:hypothetical protein [Candidatus Cybelea sp.]
MTVTPVKPLPSATVLLLRENAGSLEVFMVVRHHEIDFASGALVFPGGKVDATDSDPRLRKLCRGADGIDDATLSLRIAAIREAFEECGVLLACERDSSRPVGAARLAALHHYRETLEKGRATMADMAEREKLVFAVDALVPFAHWITPAPLPKRFDTHFFLASAPPDQLAVHDGRESVDSIWIAPLKAVADADANKATLVFATRMNLIKLGRATTVADAIAAAKADRIVTVTPEIHPAPKGRVLRIPIEAGYGISEILLEGPPRPA